MRSDFLTIGQDGLAERQVRVLKNILLVLQTYSYSQWQWVDQDAKVVLVDGDTQAGNSLAVTQQHRNRLIVPVTKYPEGSSDWEVCLHSPLKSEQVMQLLEYAKAKMQGKIQPPQVSHLDLYESNQQVPVELAEAVPA